MCFHLKVSGVEWNSNANPNLLVRTSWEGIQLVTRTGRRHTDFERGVGVKRGRDEEKDGDEVSSDFGSQLQKLNRTCKWHKSEKKKSIYTL